MRGPVFALLLSVAGSAAGQVQRPAPAAPDSAVHAVVGSPVVLGADTLFHLYGSLGPFGAAARAAAASQRLRDATLRFTAKDSVSVTDRDTYSEIAVGDQVVMTVLDADAEPLRITRPLLARRYGLQLRTVMLAAREREGFRALLFDTGYAVLATIVMLALLRLFAVGFPRLYGRIEALRRVRLRAIRIQDFELLSAGRLSDLLRGVARLVRIVLTLIVLYIYVPLVLSFSPWTAALSAQIVGYALHPFAVAWNSFVTYLPNLFYLGAGVIIVRYVLAFLHAVFGAIGSGALAFEGFYADWADPTYKIVRVLVIAFAVIALYPYLPGASSDAFKGVSIFVGVLFSLGSSAAIGNMVSGVVLTYTRAFQIGDLVRIGDTVGAVTEKTLLVTRVRTIKNVAVTIPNGAVLGSQVVNYTTLAATEGLILHTSVTIGYDAPWRTVHALLISAATSTAHILAAPPPFVLQTSLDDFYVSYEINATTDRPDRMAATYSELHTNIQESFNAAGVEIMSPHYGALRDGRQSTIPRPEPAGD